MHEHVRCFDSNADDPRQQFDHRMRSDPETCKRCDRVASISLICSLTRRRRAMSRRISARVLGGKGAPSGVRTMSSRSDASA